MDRTASPWRRAAQVPLLINDLVGVRWLRIPGRPAHLGRRVAVDAAELAVAGATDGAGHGQVNIIIPLSAEAGLRHGAPAAVGVSALHFAVASLAARARGRRVAPLPFMWPLAGGFAGVWLARAERRRSAQLAARHRVELSARRRRADLAGEHAEAMGHETLIDALGNIHWLLSTGGANPYWDRKRRLAEAARTEASYLADVVLRWARDHNASSPDLASDVAVTVAAGGSEALLTDQQVQELRRGLDGLDLTGEVTVTGPAAHICGRRLVIDVASSRLDVGLLLEADRTAPVAPLDPTPAPLAMMVPWFWFCTHQDFDGVPKWRAAPTTVAAAAVAAAAAVQHRRTGAPVSRPGLIASLALGAAHVAMVSPAVRNARTSEGNQPHPLTGALYAPLIILGLEDENLSPAGRVAARAAIVAIVGLGLALHPHRLDIRGMTGALDIFIAYHAAAGWGSALATQARDVSAELERDAEAALEASFAQGRRRVIDYIAGGAADARARIAADGARLDPELLAAVTARLDGVEAALAMSVAWGPGSAAGRSA